MYIVTFYSFKGGVGRTLALMNCAAALVKEGKKVLTVDFDLEAPGLDTFQLNLTRRKKNGIVDYVKHYLDNDVVPEIDEFLYQAKFSEKYPGELWVMPAGYRDAEYHGRLNSISWRNLYDHRDGYLLLANLKAQWESHLNPDYVLIDSRTGHTDVGGICTRQLPDAVVVLYFPNKQNLRGLATIVQKIKEEPKNITLHFAASNVPDIDDEHSILWKNMKSFRREIANMNSMETIHHYPSLPLLNQELFVLTRPKSRLASEYRKLTKLIQKENFQDEKGAMMYLRQIELDMLDFELDYEDEMLRFDLMESRIDQILSHHDKNVNILSKIVQIYIRLGFYEAADLISNQLIDIAPDSSKILARKALVASRLGMDEDAEYYARKASNLSGLSYNDIQQVLGLLGSNSQDTIDKVASWPSVIELEFQNLLQLAKDFGREKNSLKHAEQLVRAALDKVGEDADIEDVNTLVLNLIGQGQFDDAIRLVEDEIEKGSSSQAILFNFAMAKWGANQTPNTEDFRRVITHKDYFTVEYKSNANYSQCLSLVFYILGEMDRAIEYLKVAKARNHLTTSDKFSCWTYLYSNTVNFQRDLNEQEKLINSGEPLPRVIRIEPNE